MTYPVVKNIKHFLKSFFSSSSPEDNLKKVLEISDKKKEKALFVFDIDSTLFCMKYRTQAIIDQTLKEELILKDFPQHIEKLSEVKVTETDWSVVEILSRYGIKDETLLKKMNTYWRRSFFSDQYLHLDQPYEGAVAFLNKLSQSSIYYLTARNDKNLRQGTLKSLKKWGFPLQKESHLIMKTLNTETDTEYKNHHLAVLSKQFEITCFIENEPVILNQVDKSLPHVQLFWMDSTHSRKAKAPRKALTLSMNYSLS